MSTIIRIKPKITADDLDATIKMEKKVGISFERRYLKTLPIYIRKKGDEAIQKVNLIGMFSLIDKNDLRIKENLIAFAIRDKASYKIIFDIDSEYEIVAENCIDNTINVVEK